MAIRTLLCDAAIPTKVVNSIRALEIAAIPLKDIPGAVEDDKKVIEIAKTFDALIVTVDKDFTQRPLFAAMVENGSRIIVLRPSKCAPEETMETLAKLIIENHRKWQELLYPDPGIVSCNKYGNRLKKLKDFPWYNAEMMPNNSKPK